MKTSEEIISPIAAAIQAERDRAGVLVKALEFYSVGCDGKNRPFDFDEIKQGVFVTYYDGPLIAEKIKGEIEGRNVGHTARQALAEYRKDWE